MTQTSRREVLRKMAIGGAAAPFWLSGCSEETFEIDDWDDSKVFGPVPKESDLKGLSIDADLVKGINLLGWKLLAQRMQPNPFLSPAGLGLALGMLEAGSDGKTRDELHKVLSLSDPGKPMVHSWKSFAQFLRVQKPKRQLELVNVIFLQSGYDLAGEFQKQMKESFLTQMRSVDFQKDPQEAAEAIDEWVARRLRQPIPKTVNMVGMTPLTRVVLVNLIHFQGQWDQRFDPALTKEAVFEIGPNKSKRFPFMNLRHGEFSVQVTDDVRAIRLPFKERDRALHLLLPTKRHGLNDLLERAARIDWESILFEDFSRSDLDVSVPKFLMKSELRFEKPLQQLGVATVFDRDQANLSRMNKSGEPLHVAAVVQQTQFLMNEEGAKAAAVTKIRADAKSKGPHEGRPFVVDQPFLVALTDSATRTILFLGRVDDPQPIPKDT